MQMQKYLWIKLSGLAGLLTVDSLQWLVVYGLKLIVKRRQVEVKENLQWKTTVNVIRPSMENDPQQRTTLTSSVEDNLFNRGQTLLEDDRRWKTTFDGGQP